MSTTGLRWGLRSDVGMVRRINQDAAMANDTLFAVADGMGGHRGGEVASEIAAGHFRIVEQVLTIEELERTVTLFVDAEVEFSGLVPPDTEVTVSAKKVFWRRNKLRSKATMALADGTLVCAATISGMGVKR